MIELPSHQTRSVDGKMIQEDHARSSIKLAQVKTNRSIPAAFLHTLIKPFRPRIIKPGKPLPGGSQKLEVPSSIQADYEVTESSIEDVWTYSVSPKRRDENSAPIKDANRLLYFAGGSFQAPPSKDHWKFLGQLSTELYPMYSFTMVSYPLAPNTTASSSLAILGQFLRKALDQAADDGVSMTLAGDSSGANIAISMALKSVPAYDANGGRSRPTASIQTPLKAILAISPAVDMRNTNPDIPEANKHDPVLTRDYIEKTAGIWAGGLPRHDPDISPLLADLRPLKDAGIKVHGVFGTFDVLAPDAILFRKKLEEATVEGEWLEWEKQMHCFPLAFHYGLPESVRAKEWIVDVLKRSA